MTRRPELSVFTRRPGPCWTPPPPVPSFQYAYVISVTRLAAGRGFVSSMESLPIALRGRRYACPEARELR